jgi:hypothetical protein
MTINHPIIHQELYLRITPKNQPLPKKEKKKKKKGKKGQKIQVHT